jgi:hypothetical protein
MAFIVKKSYIPILDLQQNITIPTLLSSAGSSQNYVFSTTDDIYFEAEVYLNSYADGNAIIEATSATYGILNEFSFQVIGENGAGESRLLPVGSFGIYNGTRGESLSIHYTDVAIIDLNTWTKVTAKRINGVWSLFINDIACSVSRFDDNEVPNDQFGNIDLPVYIGRSEVGDLNFDGQIKNVFLGKGNKSSLIIKKNKTFKIPRTLFLPSSLGGLSLWLKADAGVTLAGSNVTAWADQSENGLNANGNIVGGVNPLFVSNVKNGKPILRFGNNNAATVLRTGPTTFGNSGNFTIIAVYNYNNSGNVWAAVVSKGDLSSSVGSQIDFEAHYINGDFGWTNVFGVMGSGPTWLYSSTSTSYANQWVIHEGISDITNNSQKMFINASEVSSSNSVTSINALNIEIGIGNAGSNAEPWTADFGGFKGDLAEVICYNRGITTPERQQVEAYLNQKYNIY